MTDKHRFQRLDSESACEKIGRDLTYHAQRTGQPRIFGRDDEIRQLMTLMIRPRMKNVIIIGEPGVGKTSLIEEIAYRIATGNVPEKLQGKRIIQTSFSDAWAQVSNSDNWGAYLNLLRNLIKECNDMAAFVFMDEFHSMCQHKYSMSYIRPALASGELNLLGATTEREYHTFVAPDPSLIRRMQVLRLKEPTESATCDMISNILKSELNDYGCTLRKSDTLKYLVQLTNSYIPYQFQPSKSLSIIEQIAAELSAHEITSRVDSENTQKISQPDGSTVFKVPAQKEITKPQIRKAVCKSVGIPEEAIIAPRERLEAMQEVLNSQIIGQNDAIAKLCRRLYISKARVSVFSDRPDGVFLLAGPTGVGKTELAKALSNYLTGSDKSLLRLDMSAYNMPQSVASLIGTAAGKRTVDDFQELPLLTRLLMANPYGVLLLDEIEKANKEVILLFLQAFDTGKMIDSLGNELYLKNLVVIMTTNTGFSERMPVITTPGQSDRDDIKEFERAALECIKNNDKFPEEFLGRIDDILLFKPLTTDIMQEFVGQKIRTLEKITGKKIDISEKARQLICKEGFTKEYGARDLNRAVDNLVGYNLAKIRLSDDWTRVEKIIIDVTEGKADLDISPVYSEERKHGLEFIAS